MTEQKPYRVHVIVDRAFGERLREIPDGEPVWIVDTAVNRAAYDAIVREIKPASHLEGLSAFKVDSRKTPEDWLIGELETLELHHGECSHDPAWSVINVIGTRWSQRIQTELTGFDFVHHADTTEGFLAWKDDATKTSPAENDPASQRM